MIILDSENEIEWCDNNDEPIYLFTQFFVPPDKIRKKEIFGCLRHNIRNPLFTKIFLLNESIIDSQHMPYDPEEKVQQFIIGKRIDFISIYEFIAIKKLQGYIVVANADIYFNKTLSMLQKTNLHNEKSIITLLRYDQNPMDHDEPIIFGPRYDSQDSWIFHTNYCLSSKYWKGFNIPIGTVGCDNKILYIFKILGFKIYNIPKIIQSIHWHHSKFRNYYLPECHTPFLFSMPSGFFPNEYPKFIFNKLCLISSLTRNFSTTNFLGINDSLRSMVESSILDDRIFLTIRWSRFYMNLPEEMRNILNKTVELSSMCFVKDPLYCKDVELIQRQIMVFENKNHVSDNVLEIFHYRFYNPWTLALAGKKILIMSPFNVLININCNVRESVWDGFDFFPGCEFVFLDPLVAQESPDAFLSHLRQIDFDIAILDLEQGLDLCIAYTIFTATKKSCMVVGNVLPLWFGIYNRAWMTARPDIFRLYINEHWIMTDVGFDEIDVDE
jgi:hypothetical protein